MKITFKSTMKQRLQSAFQGDEKAVYKDLTECDIRLIGSFFGVEKSDVIRIIKDVKGILFKGKTPDAIRIVSKNYTACNKNIINCLRAA